jgi:hypothetical protein
MSPCGAGVTAMLAAKAHVTDRPSSQSCRSSATGMPPFRMGEGDLLRRGLFRREAVHFSLEQRRKFLPTLGRRVRRVPRHLRRMAQELPDEWGQHLAADTQAGSTPAERQTLG